MIVISVDGLNPDALVRLGAHGAPTLHGLMLRGATTMEGRTAVESTRTLPNHSGMLTGRRVAAADGGHGVTFNEDSGATVDDAAGGPTDSLFDVVAEAGLHTALVASKAKFALYARTWGDSLASSAILATSEDVIAAALAEVDQGPGVVFAHVALPDEVGHSHGFLSWPYFAAVRRVDRALRPVLDHLAGASGRSTALILTADHGGNAAGHGDVTDPGHFTVPFIIVAPGVPAGGDLAALVGLTAPPDRQPSYTGPQPVRNADVANAVTGLLDLPRVPGSEFDAVRVALAK